MRRPWQKQHSSMTAAPASAQARPHEAPPPPTPSRQMAAYGPPARIAQALRSRRQRDDDSSGAVWCERDLHHVCLKGGARGHAVAEVGVQPLRLLVLASPPPQLLAKQGAHGSKRAP